MTLTAVQAIEGNSASSTSSTSATYASATTSGNILWYAIGGDKSAGVWTGPAGFTTLFNMTSTSVSLLVGYKVSDGTETTITVSRSVASAAGDRLWITEYSSNQSGTWTIVGSASNPTDESTATSWSTGTTAATTAAGGALAIIAKDSWSTGNGTPTYTNSFTEIHTFGSGGRGCVSIAFKDGIAAGSTVETTQSQTTGGDQTSGAIAVFEKVSTAVGTPYARYRQTRGVTYRSSHAR